MHQSVIKVTRWNLKVISLRIPLHMCTESEPEINSEINTVLDY